MSRSKRTQLFTTLRLTEYSKQMKRRTLISAIGGLTTSGIFAVGSGAFTSVGADRSVTIKTAQDDFALLQLDDLGNGAGAAGFGRSVENSDSEVEFYFPGFGEDEELGLGTNSVYEFDQDSDATQDGLLQITNQGTQTVDVYSRHQTNSEIEIELYDVTEADKTALRDNPVTLDVGESVAVGFRIRTAGADIGEFNETLTIVAEV